MYIQTVQMFQETGKPVGLCSKYILHFSVSPVTNGISPLGVSCKTEYVLVDGPFERMCSFHMYLDLVFG